MMKEKDLISFKEAKSAASFVFKKRKTNFIRFVKKYRSTGDLRTDVRPFSFKNFPFQKKILKSFDNEKISKVVLMAGSQLGKTELYLNLILYWAIYKGGNILLFFSNAEMGREFMASRFNPLVESNEVFRKIFPLDSKGKELNRLDSRVYKTKNYKGKIYIKSGSSLATLRSFVAKLIIMDELDLWKVKDGLNPVLQAETRSGSYKDDEKKIILCSTPLSDAKSFISKEFENSKKHYFYLNCEFCNGYFPFSEDLVEKIDHFVFLKCKLCLKKIKTKEKAIQNGKWVSHNENNEVFGFQFSRFLSPVVTLESFLRDRENQSYKDFQSNIMGFPYSEAFENQYFSDFYERRVDFYNDPRYKTEAFSEIKIITCGADVQEDRIELEIVGWGAPLDGVRKNWSLDYKVFRGEVFKTAFWYEIYLFLLNFSFFGKQIDFLLIDRGFLGEKVLESFTVLNNLKKEKNHKILFCTVKGTNFSSSFNENVFFYNAKPGSIVKDSKYLAFVNTSEFKDIFFGTFSGDGKNKFFFPIDREIQYFKGLASEEKNWKGNWEKIYKKNEPLDCRIYAMAALRLCQKLNLKQAFL